MSKVDAGIETQIRNIEAQYGKSLAEWIILIKRSGKVKHTEVVAMLKNDYGMTHGSAHRISLKAREATEPPKQGNVDADTIGDLYTGRKAGLKPIHDALMSAVSGFGDDIELAPKKGYVSLRRKKQFAMIQPSTTTRIDIGLILKDMPTIERLEPASNFNALFTHRVRLSTLADVDKQLIAWLKKAYALAG